MSNSKLTTQDVSHIAHLARLTLTEEELQKFQQQLSDILTYIDTLQKVDTTQTETSSQVTGLTNIFREDVIDSQNMLSQAQALSNAKETSDGYFVVPATIDKE